MAKTAPGPNRVNLPVSYFSAIFEARTHYNQMDVESYAFEQEFADRFCRLDIRWNCFSFVSSLLKINMDSLGQIS